MARPHFDERLLGPGGLHPLPVALLGCAPGASRANARPEARRENLQPHARPPRRLLCDSALHLRLTPPVPPRPCNISVHAAWTPTALTIERHTATCATQVIPRCPGPTPGAPQTSHDNQEHVPIRPSNVTTRIYPGSPIASSSPPPSGSTESLIVVHPPKDIQCKAPLPAASTCKDSTWEHR